MKKMLISMLIGLSATMLLTGCVLGFSFGGGKKDTASTTSNASTTNNNQHPATDPQMVEEPTIGQQLIDLKKARDTDAITESEYEAEKAKLLGNNPVPPH
jgi:hypothetical protein